MKNRTHLVSTLMIVICLFTDCRRPESFIDKSLQPVDINRLSEISIKQNVNISFLPYRDSLGNPLNDTLREQLRKGLLVRQVYLDGSGSLKEIRVKTPTLEGMFDEIQLRSIMSYPLAQYEFVEVNCDDFEEILLSAFENDQDSRNGLIELSVVQVDKQNEPVIISLMHQCGWELVNEKTAKPLFYIYQHMDGTLMAYFYNKIVELANRGLIEKATLALMQDRLLMFNGYDQLYGSQVIHNSFYKIKDPINLNKRRSAVGLGSIEEYAKRFGINYDYRNHLD